MVYYTKDEFAQAATSTPSESFGWYDGGADFRWRANASVLWEYNDFTTSLNFRFLDDNKDDCWLSTYYGLKMTVLIQTMPITLETMVTIKWKSSITQTYKLIIDTVIQSTCLLELETCSVKSLQLHTMHLLKILTLLGTYLAEHLFMVDLKSHYKRA